MITVAESTINTGYVMSSELNGVSLEQNGGSIPPANITLARKMLAVGITINT